MTTTWVPTTVRPRPSALCPYHAMCPGAPYRFLPALPAFFPAGQDRQMIARPLKCETHLNTAHLLIRRTVGQDESTSKLGADAALLKITLKTPAILQPARFLNPLAVTVNMAATQSINCPISGYVDGFEQHSKEDLPPTSQSIKSRENEISTGGFSDEENKILVRKLDWHVSSGSSCFPGHSRAVQWHTPNINHTDCRSCRSSGGVTSSTLWTGTTSRMPNQMA